MTDYTRCRTYGHAWFEADTEWDAYGGTPLTLRCERCMCERRDTIDVNGRLVGRYYIYPQNYQYAKGERPSRDDFRLALLSLRLKEARAARRHKETA